MLTLRVWATALIPTQDELRLGLLAGAVAFLAIVATVPLWRLPLPGSGA